MSTPREVRGHAEKLVLAPHRLTCLQAGIQHEQRPPLRARTVGADAARPERAAGGFTNTCVLVQPLNNVYPDPGPQEAHRVAYGPLRCGRARGGLAGGLGPGAVQLHVRLPLRLLTLQRPSVLVVNRSPRRWLR